MSDKSRNHLGIIARVDRLVVGDLRGPICRSNLVRARRNTNDGEMFYGATEFSVVDPNNFVLTFAEDE